MAEKEIDKSHTYYYYYVDYACVYICIDMYYLVKFKHNWNRFASIPIKKE